MIVSPIKKRIWVVSQLGEARSGYGGWGRGREADIAHCEPAQRDQLSDIRDCKRRMGESYIALSKNMITPPIKKNPPVPTSALRSAPQHGI